MKNLLAKAIRGVVVVLSVFPLRFHYFMGDILSWFIRNVARYRSGLVMLNLSRSFPELKYKQVKKIHDSFYRHLGEIVAEAIWFGGSTYEKIRKKGLVTLTNAKEISEIFDSTPSMTVLCTHCGNWEILGGFLGYRTPDGADLDLKEEQIKVVYKELHSAFSNEFFKHNRVAPLEKVGTTCEIESSNILRYAIKHRNEKNVYIYIADQYPYKTPYDIGVFLNQKTSAMLGAAGVACKLGHSVIYLKMKRVERGRYEMTFVPICMNASEQTPEQITRRYFDILEEEICETPANWLWSHKRWK